MKLLKRPQLAASIAATVDIVMLAAAVVLSYLRGSFATEYSFDAEKMLINSRHPYDYFGIVAAVALVVAAAMTAFIIAGAVMGDSKKRVPRLVGGAALMILSTAAVLLSWFIVKGQQPQSVEYYPYTDKTMQIVVAEEKYDYAFGVAKFFLVDEDAGTAKLLISTDITTFTGEDTERYKFEWIAEDQLRIVFFDGTYAHEIQIDPYAE